jgi:hypothetical protein
MSNRRRNRTRGNIIHRKGRGSWNKVQVESGGRSSTMSEAKGE